MKTEIQEQVLLLHQKYSDLNKQVDRLKRIIHSSKISINTAIIAEFHESGKPTSIYVEVEGNFLKKILRSIVDDFIEKKHGIEDQIIELNKQL